MKASRTPDGSPLDYSRVCACSTECSNRLEVPAPWCRCRCHAEDYFREARKNFDRALLSIRAQATDAYAEAVANFYEDCHGSIQSRCDLVGEVRKRCGVAVHFWSSPEGWPGPFLPMSFSTARPRA